MIGMSHLLRFPLEDVASLALLIALQRGQEIQVIAPRCTLGMEKAREEGISKKEEGLPLNQVCHLLMILKSLMHLVSLPQISSKAQAKRDLSCMDTSKEVGKVQRKRKEYHFSFL